MISSVHAGILVGILLRYGIPGPPPKQFIFSKVFSNETCHEDEELQVGRLIQISSWNSNDSRGGDTFLASIVGKVFRAQQGNYIRDTVSLHLYL